VLSVPNFGHWYSRLRVALGAFDYDRRGILDETHLRFFSRSSLRRMIRNAGYDLLELRSTGSPFVQLAGAGAAAGAASALSRTLVGLRPTLFGYQYVARLTPHAQEVITAGQSAGVDELLAAQARR
jgi:hypothetical protein